MGLANLAALLAGVGDSMVGVACEEELVLITPYDHQPPRRSIPARHTQNKPRARPDWEGDDFGDLGREGFMRCRSSLKFYR
jgi:hypothetical protein